MFQPFYYFIFTACLLGGVAGSTKVHRPPTTSNSSSQETNNSIQRALRATSSTEKTRQPMLELMSMSLDTWGVKTGNATVELIQVTGNGNLVQPVDHTAVLSGLNPLAQVPLIAGVAGPPGPEISSLDAALNVHLYSIMNDANVVRMLITLILTAVVILSLGYCCMILCIDGEEANQKDAMGSPLKESRSPMGEVPMHQSSWARAYYEAEGEQREAFELLFRCNIISTEEFACSVISQEHIQECLWIATHMLQNKPLEEWVSLWQQAQQGFEDSVAECFEARGGQVGLTARALAQRLHSNRGGQYMSPTSSPSMPSSANLDFVRPDSNLDLRPLHS